MVFNKKEYNKNHPERIKARDIAQYKLKHLRPEGYGFHYRDYPQPLLAQTKIHRELHNSSLLN